MQGPARNTDGDVSTSAASKPESMKYSIVGNAVSGLKERSQSLLGLQLEGLSVRNAVPNCHPMRRSSAFTAA